MVQIPEIVVVVLEELKFDLVLTVTRFKVYIKRILQAT